MDRQPVPGRAPSGIPRLASRLPVPTSTASKSLRPSPSRERLKADPGLDLTRLRRPSEEFEFKKPLPKAPSAIKPRKDTEYVPRLRANDFESAVEETDLEDHSTEVRGRERVVRPSLSERTIETLSQIPPSPRSTKKQSNFFYPTSPMRSPSRPSSTMSSYSRSPSRPSSRQYSGTDVSSSATSTMRLPSRSRMAAAPSLTSNGSSADRGSLSSAKSPSRLRAPGARVVSDPDMPSPNAATPKRFDSLPSRTSVHGGLKSPNIKPLGARPTLGKPFRDSSETTTDPVAKTLFVKKTRPDSSSSSNITPSFSASTTPKAPSVTSDQPPSEQSAESEAGKGSKSSSALREAIAKAKAARRKASKESAQAIFNNSGDDDASRDPFNQLPKEDPNKELLRSRVEAGRTSGRLNIAAMSLKEIPNEVMTMYDFNPDSNVDWYESVDLSKLIAADNELAQLPDAAFPDVDPESMDPDADERSNQFAGLEVLDLHGNVLNSLPIGLRRLQRLHTLNLSNNLLNMDDIQVIMEIESLADLRLANNNLQGSFTSTISRVSKLENLDLHGNSLTGLPETLGELDSLKILNLGENQLTSLPCQTLGKLPLRELNVSKNKLKGTLISTPKCQFQNLQVLDVSNNALEGLSEDEKLDLPSLQTISIAFNRIKDMPDVSSWQNLLTLLAEDNMLAELPPGFFNLKNVKNVDLSANDISKLDERIGLMDSLTGFRIAGNPIRERKFLSMGTEDIKRDLRNRCQLETQETDDEESSVATHFTLAPEDQAERSALHVKPGGVLDLSHNDMKELEADKLQTINTQEVRFLYLHHNELHTFPAPALSILADSLTDLDLSNNPLDSASFLASPLTLPKLRTLNLSATSLTSLEPLLTNLSAPSLTFLDVSYNRLTGKVPCVREKYPKLATFLIADNKVSSVDFEAAQGLQVLDVSNNDIGFLPPKIGLLRAEGSSENWGGGTALRRFEVAGNLFRVPRWQVVAQGTDAILEWLKNRIPEDELAQLEQ